MTYEHGIVMAEGDFVIIHGRFAHIGQAANWVVVDICRLEAGVIVEHWDVIQDEVGLAASAGGRPEGESAAAGDGEELGMPHVRPFVIRSMEST